MVRILHQLWKNIIIVQFYFHASCLAAMIVLRLRYSLYFYVFLLKKYSRCGGERRHNSARVSSC